MARSYSIDRALTFDDQTGYWLLSVEITSTSEVSPYPFLMEKAVLGTDVSNSLATSSENPRYLRTVIESDTTTQRLVTDTAIYDTFTWVQYRDRQFTRTFYTYRQAEEALQSVMAVLKSNARVYSTSTSEPRLVAINLSSSDKIPNLESIAVTKGDTISLQLVGGSADTEIISDGAWISVSNESTAPNRKSNSYIVTITDVDNLSYLGLREAATSIDHTISVTVNSTPLEGSDSEVIR